MPRKQKKEKKVITVVVNGHPVGVTLFPPDGTHRSWYAYWSGLKSRRSTGQRDFDGAVEVVHDMLTNNGRKTLCKDALLSDAEFDEIQRRHYGKRKDPEKQKRARKSFKNCMEAIAAFRQISGLTPISIATPDDCERFQNKALELLKDWRVHYGDSSLSKQKRAKKNPVENLSPNTVVKWSVALQAAFERVCKNAGDKCVRGVVPESKLLLENPWRQFGWIEGRDPEIRQFDEKQLGALLNHFESGWPQVTTASAAIKVFLWSYARRREVAGLRWTSMRVVGDEVHFDIVGKWGVRKWFRIPTQLYKELLDLKGENEFVFADFTEQLRQYHLRSPNPRFAARVREEFDPENFGDWLYNKIVDWSKSFPDGNACLHMLRKTSLQYARSGEDVNRQVAADARVTTAVMMTNYVKETDEEMRQKSNRTFARISASLSLELAKRFGHVEVGSDPLKEQIRLAVASENWELVQQLTIELTKRKQPGSEHL